ncbi:MAG: ABC transporter [Actinobacteria bacterium 13_1_20CM_3_71_11]|nr:MAG: ABC transporter [Actinobacteria bacterium 13_1_20CM_3_71_11]
MTSFLALARAMLLGYRRDRTALFFTLLFPLIFLVIFGGLFKSGGIPKSSVVLVGSVPLVEQLPADGHGQLDQVLKISRTDDVNAAIAKVRSGDAAAAIEQHGNQLVVHYSQADATAAGTVRGVVESLVQSANLAASGQPPRFSVQAEQVEDKALKPIQYFTPGILGYAIAIGATFGAAATLVTWRQKKILRRLTLSPVKVPAVIGARIVVAVGIALVQMVIFIAIASLPYFGLKLSHSWWMAIPLILCGTLAFMSIGLLAGAKAKSTEAASAIANLITIPMAFLSGSFFPIEGAPGWIQGIAKVFPLRHLNTGMLDVMVRDKPPLSVLPEMGILLGFAVVLGGIAAWLFRWDDV